MCKRTNKTAYPKDSPQNVSNPQRMRTTEEIRREMHENDLDGSIRVAGETARKHQVTLLRKESSFRNDRGGAIHHVRVQFFEANKETLDGKIKRLLEFECGKNAAAAPVCGPAIFARFDSEPMGT